MGACAPGHEGTVHTSAHGGGAGVAAQATTKRSSHNRRRRVGAFGDRTRASSSGGRRACNTTNNKLTGRAADRNGRGCQQSGGGGGAGGGAGGAGRAAGEHEVASWLARLAGHPALPPGASHQAGRQPPDHAHSLMVHAATGTGQPGAARHTGAVPRHGAGGGKGGRGGGGLTGLDSGYRNSNASHATSYSSNATRTRPSLE